MTSQNIIASKQAFDYTGAVNAAQSSAQEPDFSKGNGLVPVITQNADTGDVLMMAYMNEEAWRKTLETSQAHYYSRSREKLWRKGEESGNTQTVRSVALDCDRDTVLLRVDQKGPACHTGAQTCFTGGDVPLGGSRG
jgi:phosphoribosyl-AMP cyclohydrolase